MTLAEYNNASVSDLVGVDFVIAIGIVVVIVIFVSNNSGFDDWQQNDVYDLSATVSASVDINFVHFSSLFFFNYYFYLHSVFVLFLIFFHRAI